MNKKVTLLPEQVEAYKQELTELYNQLRSLKSDKGNIKVIRGCDDAGNSIASNIDSSLLMELSRVASRIKEIEEILEQSNVLTGINNDSEVIAIGSVFTIDTDLAKDLTFTLVQIGGNPVNGLISVDSPIGAAVVGKGIGEAFSYTTPNKKVINGQVKNILSLEDKKSDDKKFVK